MKKSVKIIRLIIFTLAFLFLITDITKAITVVGKAITGETVTGEAVTGEATRLLNMNITIIAAPTLSIISPKNKTYLINESLLLNYSVSGQDSIWYNLDSIENITITSPLYFNISEGSHILHLYANNSQGATSTSVTFVVNLTRFIIQKEEFNGSTKGSSTDFKMYTYEELQNLSSIIFENTLAGKILFNHAINLIDDGNPSDDFLDIDSNINISFKRIDINSTALPNFNKSATLWLHNLTFSNPRILKNGEACPSSICTKESYLNGILKFNVTGFSIYSAEETPATTGTPSPTSGGGGSALTKITEEFSVDIDELKVRIVLNDVKEREIKIKNTGENNITIKASLEGEEMEEIISFENDELSLAVGEEEIIKLNITAIKLKIYAGKIILSSMAKTKEVLVTINTQSKETLFDISIAIPEDIVNKDEALKAQVNLIPLGEKGVDVILKYLIKDFKGKVYHEESKTFYIDEQKSFAKEFKISKLEYGHYVLGIEMTYAGGFASTSIHFEVKEEEKPSTFIKAYYMYFIILIILIIAVLFVIFELRKMQKYKRYKKEYTIWK